MTATWTDPTDEALNGIVTYVEWNALVGNTGNLQYLYEQIQRALGGQLFIEGATHKGIFALGAPSAEHGYAANTLVGFGMYVIKDASASIVVSVPDADRGMWKLTTNAGANNDVGFRGPQAYYTADWSLVCRARAASVADQTIIIGAKPTSDFADENGVIGFRISGTGNLFGVSDSGGTETTRDSSATLATEAALRMTLSAAGTSLSFYKNGAIIGTAVTTNIPTLNTEVITAGISTQVGAAVTLYLADLFGWRENG